MNTAEVAEILDRALRNVPDATFVDIYLDGHEHAKRHSIKLVQGLKAVVRGKSHDAMGKPVTVVRAQTRDLKDYLMREKRIATAPQMVARQAIASQVKSEVRHLRKIVDRSKAGADPITTVVVHKDCVPAAIPELLKVYKLRLMRTKFLKPWDVELLGDLGLTALRAKTLEDQHEPLEYAAPLQPDLLP